MKKLICTVLCCTLMAFMGVCAYAVQTVPTAMDLFQLWNGSEGYPDYICGVYVTPDDSGSLTFAVTKDEAGEVGKQEILDTVEDDSTVKFTYGSYPYSELKQVIEQLDNMPDMQTSGAIGWGIDESENCVHVDINMSQPGAEKFVQDCRAKYGDKIRFEDSDGAVAYDTSSYDRGMGGAWTLLAAAAALLLAAGAGALLLRKKVPAFAGAPAYSRQMSSLQTVLADTVIVPAAELDEKIMGSIKKIT